MVHEVAPDCGSLWSAICAVAGKRGGGAPETVRMWVSGCGRRRQAAGVTTQGSLTRLPGHLS